MIYQLVFFFSILFSLTLLPSCTIFESGDLEESAEEEDYYAEEEDAVEEEPEESSLAEEVGLDSPIDEEDDIYYIDEEDEEFIAEEEGSIEVEDVDSDDLSTEGKEDSDEDYNTAESSFFSQETPSSSGAGEKADPHLKKKKWISYKKIKTQPYSSGGFLVNAVYIARQGEDIQSISNKIFGSDQVNQLYAINPHLKSRNVKVGDKIYYQSPLRPQDSRQLLFYFEDNGISPQYHQIQAGQNIRQVASRLLGHANSWKEVWATNPELNSKGIVNDALVLKYWTGAAAASPPPVSDIEEEPPSVEEKTPLEEDTTESQPLPPSPEEEDMPPEPLPPSSEEITPPPSDNNNLSSKNLLERVGMDTLIGIALVLIALLTSIVIVKKRMKKKSFDYTATSFELDE